MPVVHTVTPLPSISRTPISPTYTGMTRNSICYSRRLLESVAKGVNKSYSTYFKRPEVGRPQTASPYHNRTLEISEPANKHLKFSKKGWATVHVKGLPVIKFRTDQRLPENEQPKVIRITLKPRRLVVSLTYQLEPKTIGAPDRESVGIDPGVKHNITAVSDDGNGSANSWIQQQAPSQGEATSAPKNAKTTRPSLEGRQSTVHQPENPHRQDQTPVPVERTTLKRLPQDPGAAPQS